MTLGPVTTTALSLDTGWTANAGAGDKTAIVPNYVAALSGTMVTALNVVSAGLGTELALVVTALEASRKKIQALEIALSLNLRPNA